MIENVDRLVVRKVCQIAGFFLGLMGSGSPAEIPLSAHAAESACARSQILTGQVAEIVSATSLRLSDGREIGLSAVIVPCPTPGSQGNTRKQKNVSRPSPCGAKARLKDWLAKTLVGRGIVLRQDGPRRDRYGRWMGQLYSQEETSGRWVWVQGAMVARGLALAAPFPGRHSCLTALLDKEKQARFGRRGLWRQSWQFRLSARRPWVIAHARHRFRLVHGRVVAVGQSRKFVFLNFAKDWRRDFTGVIPKRHLPAFLTAGIDPRKLVGRTVELRGWIDMWHGPYIRLTTPHQIQLPPSHHR